jgi:hypothetical protein
LLSTSRALRNHPRLQGTSGKFAIILWLVVAYSVRPAFVGLLQQRVTDPTFARRDWLQFSGNRHKFVSSRRTSSAKSAPESDLFMPLGLALSEKQIPQIAESTEKSK